MARTRQLRGWTRRRNPPIAPQTESNLWMPAAFGNLSLDVPSLGRFEDSSEDAILTPPFSPLSTESGFNIGPRYWQTSTARTPMKTACEPTVPFDRAVESLCQALHFAVKHSRGIKDHFDETIEQSSLAQWVPPQVIEVLWTMNLEWDGTDQSKQNSHHPHGQTGPSPPVITFSHLTTRLSEAIETLRSTGFPRVEDLFIDAFDFVDGSDNNIKFSPEVFRNTMNKLHVTLRGIEELMQAVRNDRSLMEPLVKDLVAAAALLGDIEPIWMTPQRGRMRMGGGAGVGKRGRRVPEEEHERVARP